MKQLLRRIFRHFGFELVRTPPPRGSFDGFPELSAGERSTIESAQPFTMTSVERMAALIQAVTFVSKNRISGDIAECGVWRGGSMTTVALTLIKLGDQTRSLYLYDTFEGMSSPTSADRSLDGVSAEEQLNRDPVGTGIWVRAALDDVRANLASTGYPLDKIHFIKGKVEDTIPATMPERLALLRLDTDWYESTRHELLHLFPRLERQGILLIDDYGHWQGAKKAVDEYFQGQAIYLHRVDYTGRLLVRGSAL